MESFLSKDTRNKIVEVKVEGMPSSVQKEPRKDECQQESPKVSAASTVRILVELRMTLTELLARETISRPAVDYSKDMTAEEQKRYINYLAERVRKADFDLRVRDAVLQDFLDKQKEYEERLSKLDSILSDVEDLKVTLALETKKRKAAERVVRPLTTQRNNMLHFGSDEGAKMAATYHSIISTVKLQGRSAWDYLGKFFVKSLVKRRESSSLEFLSVKTLCNIFNGCRDFFSLRPGNIELAPCQYLINK